MRLRKMTPQEYAAFREFSVADYGREIAAAGRLSMDAARAQAQREFDDQLTQGENTPCNHVCIIDQAGEAQGFIWYQLAEAQAGVKYVFLCDFYVAEPHRRKGVATAALHCMEQSARAGLHGSAAVRVGAQSARPAAVRKMRLCACKDRSRRYVYEETVVKRRKNI